MTRTEKLAAYLTETWGHFYIIGHWDCIIFVAMWADLMECGHSCPPPNAVTHTSRIRDTYINERSGRQRYAPHSINAAIAHQLISTGWSEIPSPEISDLQPGDIILTNLDHPGIWDGEKIVAQPARAAGLLHIHPRHARSGWRWSPYLSAVTD